MIPFLQNIELFLIVAMKRIRLEMRLGICDAIVLRLLVSPQKSLCNGKGGDPRHMGKLGGLGGICCSSAKGSQNV